MKLHEAIEKLLQVTGHPMTTHEIAEALNKNGWYVKKDRSKITDLQIHGRTKNYQSLFNRDGSAVSLQDQQKIKRMEVQSKKSAIQSAAAFKELPAKKDEHYVLELCDTALDLSCIRQHKFDFLRGDINSKGHAKKLPVDGYYPELNLVIEYSEKQHTEAVSFFDKPGILTISGVHRGEQRKLYDQRRRELLPERGIHLVEFHYSDFEHDRQKRLLRNQKQDIITVNTRLLAYIDKMDTLQSHNRDEKY